jgi:hypothetical protein
MHPPMASLRRNLRVFATTWLLFQAAWAAAIVPRDCCAAHRPAEQGQESCHDTSGSAGQQVAAADHLHHAAPSNSPQPVSGSSSDCRLRGLCGGPMASLFALLSQHGILPAPAAALPDVPARNVTLAIDENVVARFEPPDSPPPRS